MKKFTKEEWSWIFYDWANSSYATIMLAAIFPIYFSGTAAAYGVDGDYWWGIGSSVATFIIAVFSPILGAFGDYKGAKKRLLALFISIGLIFTLSCALADSWQLMLIGYILSYIGFAGSCLFYDSFLTDITTRDRMDMISAWGYSMGYIGGSTIPFLLSIAIILFGPAYGISDATGTKISLVIAVIWWGVFSVPILKNCHQKYGVDIPRTELISTTLKNLIHSMKELLASKVILLFIFAYFFYIDGVNTVIKMSTAYGTTLGLDSTGMILALLLTQIIAFPCAILFGKLAGKFSSVNMLISSVSIYLIICILGFYMGFGIEEEFLTQSQALSIFWALSVLVGMVQGGIQALSRSYFGKLIPSEKSNEYFGVFDIFGKFAAMMGPALYSIVKGLTGRSSFAILAIILLFLAGGGILIANRKLFYDAEISSRQ